MCVPIVWVSSHMFACACACGCECICTNVFSCAFVRDTLPNNIHSSIRQTTGRDVALHLHLHRRHQFPSSIIPSLHRIAAWKARGIARLNRPMTQGAADEDMSGVYKVRVREETMLWLHYATTTHWNHHRITAAHGDVETAVMPRVIIRVRLQRPSDIIE